MAAKPTIRLWAPGVRFKHTAPLTSKLPAAPAAVPLYSRNRTRYLVFDLDAKRAGAETVQADRDRIFGWVRACGGRAITDDSTSRGAHIIVPLGVAATVDDVRALMEAAETLCPSLDKTPMINPKRGCITVPGSLCKEGGHRRLRGTVEDAVDALRRRNAPEFLALLTEHVASTATPASVRSSAPPESTTAFFTGNSADDRLLPEYALNTPMPDDVHKFAVTPLPDRWHSSRWESPSEARQSVLTHAQWRGMSLTEVLQLTTTTWALGMGQAYSRYADPVSAVTRDWWKARQWLLQMLPTVHTVAHKIQKHTGGTPPTPPDARLQTWLQTGTSWCDTTLRAHPARWTVAAVLQALAVSASRGGELAGENYVVGFGGRSLSIAAGVISESSVWAALRLLRETPGSPVLLVRRAQGKKADQYALVRAVIDDANPEQLGRPQVRDVHPVWAVIGLKYRRIYEAVLEGRSSRVTDIVATARLSRTAAYDGVAELQRIGLIERRNGQIAVTATSLDDLGNQLRANDLRDERIAEHRERRKAWGEWLATRDAHSGPEDVIVEPASIGSIVSALTQDEHDEWLDSVMRTGPPAELPAAMTDLPTRVVSRYEAAATASHHG
uniref:Uncharacterized protein n=1 Tax=Mycolicibacterium sp. CBMA 213 TaxID=1968788 RepID=A0A343VQX9_9MYCO|nr:hypothetical protein [Mycolicibacterium sp. CBMA 213]AVN58303.1 hypothetical protein B5P44_p00008 [Mycolicibacterium sp. CBMA 213]